MKSAILPSASNIKFQIASLVFRQIALLTILMFICFSSSAQTVLDSSYGINGKLVVETGFENSPFDYYYFFNSVTLTKDSSILTFEGDNYYLSQYDILRKFKKDGSVDASFGNNGSVSIFGGYDGKAIELPDGKILMCYYYSGFISGAQNYYTVAKLLPNGQLDPSFGSNGKVTYRYSDEEYETDAAYTLTVRPNGKILVAGQFNYYQNKAVVQLLPNGAIDNSFGDNGYLVETTLYEKTAYDIISLPDNKFVIAYASAIIKYTSDGKIDSTAPYNGVYTNVPNGDGKRLYITGNRLYAACKGTSIYRFKPNGTIDSSFASNGILQIEGKYNPFLSFDKTGFYAADNNSYSVTRFTKSGKLDTAFGTGGTVSTTFDGYSSQKADAPVATANNKVVIVGKAYGSNVNVALAQFTYLKPKLTPVASNVVATKLDAVTTFISPNPVSNALHLGNLPDKPIHIQLMNNNGSVIKTFSNVSNSFTINMAQLSSGIYYVALPQLNKTFKVIKE